MKSLPSKINAKHIKELQSRGYCIINEIGNGSYSRVFKAEKFDDNTNTTNTENEQHERNSKGNYESPEINTQTKTKKHIGNRDTEIDTETDVANNRENNEREAADVSIKKTDINRSIVAIKLISHRQSAANFTTKFLRREVDVVRSISHRNIVETKEILCSPDNATYIITEYSVRGDLLNYICLRGALSEKLSKSYFSDMISAIEYLHGIDVAHRDIKCENLLVHTDPTDKTGKTTILKIADFGFSREIFDNQVSTTFCGSPAYAAPEIIQGKAYNPRLTDVWSCGVVLYIMVNASMPFDDGNLNELLLQQNSPLRRVDVGINEDLHLFMQGLMTVDPKKRSTLDTMKHAKWFGRELGMKQSC